MTNRQAKSGHTYIILALLLLVFAALSGWISPTAFAKADTKEYTTALEDLQRDNTFDVSEYPDDPNDYSIRLIQIAESADGELYVYTYQPSQVTTYLVASEINMSLSEDPDKTKLYGLTLLNTSGVFGKYKVNDLSVKAVSVRFYNISSIYRSWDKDIDEGSGSDNTITAVSFEVGRLYTVITVDGKVTYDCKDVEVVKVENKWNSALVYPDGLTGLFEAGACTSHFVAFKSDHQIDALLEADVTFVKQPYTAKAKNIEYTLNPDYSKFTYTYGKSTTELVTLHYDDIVENDGSGIGGKKHVWNRIESVSDFLKNEDLSGEAKKQLANKQWVLRYYESERHAEMTHAGTVVVLPAIGLLLSEYVIEDERTTDVTILRLEFETDGKLYNLGVVDNKQTGNSFANGSLDDIFDFFAWLEKVTGVPQWVWICIAALIPLAILLPVLSVIFPAFGQLMLWLLKGLWWIISAPFKGIAAFVRKIKNRAE